MPLRATTALLLATVAVVAAPVVLSGITPAPPTRAHGPVEVHADGLHNVFRVGNRLYSGSSPEGDAGFAALRALGVRTVLSVDGATPDVAAAKAHGLRYVHLPVGYDGIPAARAYAIAKAVRESAGPVYVHCHHGKHRGPAAAACALLTLEPRATPQAAEAWLRVAGTDPKYTGLTALPRTLRRPTAVELTALRVELPETAAVPDLTRLMVHVDERWARLTAAKDAKWDRPADARHEAVQLTELYREAARLPSASAKGEPFLALLRDAERHADALEQALAAADRTAAGRAFDLSRGACSRCHARFRD